ncbi:MAG TPA: lipoprotein signal peptidase [Bacteroidetes bacterium]|nr:lipoprotein signal peptidase [Bacteroidota bacterium]
MKKSYWAILVIILILIIDQASKIYIKTHLGYGEGFDILGLKWAKIYFVENKGMAYGMEIGGEYGKLILSLFRIIMIIVLVYFLVKLIQANEKLSLILSFSLIIAGALGNIIDSAFYGMIFSETPRFHGGVAQLFPPEGGYSSFLHGKVVDMFYFPIIDTYLPEWVPIWGGERFIFFQPVFNVADSAITVGVVLLLLFNRSYFTKKDKKNPATHTEQEKISLEKNPEENII